MLFPQSSNNFYFISFVNFPLLHPPDKVGHTFNVGEMFIDNSNFKNEQKTCLLAKFRYH